MNNFKGKIMSKQKKPLAKAMTSETDLGRGKIKDKIQVVKAKKGKGSFQRKAKHLRRESYLIAA